MYLLALKEAIEYITVILLANVIQNVIAFTSSLIYKLTHILTVAGGTGIVEMLFCTSLVALVGAGEHPAFSPRQLQIINTKVITFFFFLSTAMLITIIETNNHLRTIIPYCYSCS